MREISSLFTKEVVTVRPTETLAQAAQLMDERNVGAVVVAEQQRPVGIVTDRDLAIALGARGAARSEAVQKVMTCPVNTLSQDEGVMQATQRMMENAQRRMPVVDDFGRLVGLVTLDDLLVLLGRELDNLGKGVQAEMVSHAGA
jgi:CBS domain-containing protein